ncbi:MAG: MFS transporter [Candidatus Sumerlaeota bacterium]|nr:MFS transporter [Candidatus Sumerlaeota bacterium]
MITPNREHREPLSWLQWLILALLFFSTVINYVDRQALSLLKGTLSDALNLSDTDYGAVTMAFLITYSVSQVMLGAWVDRIGVRIGLGLGALVWSVAAILHAFVRGPWSLGAMRVVLGAGEGANWPAGGKAIARWFPQNWRAFAMGVFDGGSAVGAVLAPPIVAFLAIKWGWRAAFVATGALGLIWTAAWFWLYDDPSRHRWLPVREREASAAERREETATRMSFAQSARFLFGLRPLWGLVITRFIATSVWWFYVLWLPDYFQKEREFTLAEIGYFAWIPYLTADAGKIVGGILSDRWLDSGASPTLARKSVMVAGAACMMAGMAVAGAPTSVGAMFWACVATFGFGVWSANILALHADIFPSRLMGSAIGLTGMASSFGGSVLSFAVALIVSRHGYGDAFLLAGALPAVACVALIFGVGRVEPVLVPTLINGESQVEKGPGGRAI